jgi:hypothetical protein
MDHNSTRINVPELCELLRAMDDPELISFGVHARYMCSPEANSGAPPPEYLLVQLTEAMPNGTGGNIARPCHSCMQPR